MFLKEKIPSIYHTFLIDLINIEVPDEEIATCINCTLCRTDKSPYLDVKCCNYFPKMANFQLGGILQEKEFQFAKNKIKSIIKTKVGTTPYGILPGKKFSNRQNTILKKKEFFNSKEEYEEQKCPYYDDGRCSVWKYRESLCVTFYCSSIGGESGDQFWSKLNEFLKLIEKKLAIYALLRLNWESSTLKLSNLEPYSFKVENDNSKISKKEYELLWQNWKGKEEELYIKSFLLIQKLSQAEFISILGLEYEIYNKAIIDLAANFNIKKYPKYLKLNDKIIIDKQKNGIVKLKLNDTSIKMGMVYLPFLKKFDGINETVKVFHLAFDVIISLSQIIDKLLKADMLQKIDY